MTMGGLRHFMSQVPKDISGHGIRIYKINEVITISINIGVQYWSLVNVNLKTGWEKNYGFAPAFSFPAVHINFNPKTSMTLSYGDGDAGDMGLIGFAYVWN